MVYFLRVRKRPAEVTGMAMMYTAGWAKNDSTLKKMPVFWKCCRVKKWTMTVLALKIKCAKTE